MEIRFRAFTVKRLIEELIKYDPDKEIYIQQGVKNLDAVPVLSVREHGAEDTVNLDGTPPVGVVVIQYFPPRSENYLIIPD